MQSFMKSADLPRVGFWWSEKKSRRFNVCELTKICRNAGLELVKIDLECSLEEQGPFAAIIHKLSDSVVKADQGDLQSRAFCKAFEEYVTRHPDIAIIDPIENVRKLLDRYRQYKLIDDSELQKEGGVFIPAFVELTTMNKEENIAKLKSAGVEFPFVCKPTVAHGSALAHKMSLIFNENGLKDISPPCVAQTFVSHNAVLYKLFIIGDKYFISERPSLKNFTAGDYETIFFDSHDISKPHSSNALNQLDDSEPKTPITRPEKGMLDNIVRVVSDQLGLALFGIDVIVDNATGHYAIIDMNAFPGYDGVDDFLQLICDLIVDRISENSLKFITSAISKSSWHQSPIQLQNQNKFFHTLPKSERHTSTAPFVISNCVCCPITGFCINALSLDALPYLPVSNNKSQCLEETCKEMADKNSENAIKGPEILVIKTLPDSHDDSGIDTSDSCDEKKNREVIFRTIKRQHSRNHTVPGT